MSGELTSMVDGMVPGKPQVSSLPPSPPAPPPGDAAGLVPVTLNNSVRTSAGIPGEPRDGPWLVYLPPDEAARVVADRNGTYGTEPPRGCLGAVEPVVAAMVPRRAPEESPR